MTAHYLSHSDKFSRQWQRTSTVVTSVSSPPIKSGKRAIAIYLVDIFGNDASVTVSIIL
jgi:hypothetical protein